MFVIGGFVGAVIAIFTLKLLNQNREYTCDSCRFLEGKRGFIRSPDEWRYKCEKNGCFDHRIKYCKNWEKREEKDADQ